MSSSIGDGISVVALAGALVGYLYLKSRERQRRVEIIHQERLAAMDKGIPLPELPIDPPPVEKRPDPHIPLILGIVLMAFGVGSMITLGVVASVERGYWSTPLPLALVGLGLMLYYFLAGEARALIQHPVAAMDTDEKLVERCRSGGGEDAFTELVGRYRERVFRLAVSILGPEFRGDAEEVAQEVFLRVHHALASFRGEAQFSSWIYRIAFNQAVNLKARVRYRAVHLSDDALAGAASPLMDPHERLEAARKQQALTGCMDELPEVYQSALRLHYWLGEGVAEIGLLLGVPENTVKSYLHRARRLLHEMLKERGFRDV